MANEGSGTVSVLLGTGTGSFGAKTDFTIGGQPYSVAIADLNSDGKPDLAVANANTVSVLLGTGTGSFGAKTDFETGIVPYWVAIADLNGDGNPDLVVTNYNSNTVSVLLGTGTGSFGANTEFALGTQSNPAFVAIADLNGDGKPDLAVANDASNTISVLLGTGTGSFGANTDFANANSGDPIAVAIADLNGDGKPDLAVANMVRSAVSVLLGTGTGSFGASTDFASGGWPIAVAIADLNGDGRPDLALGNYYSATVSVLLNTTPCTGLLPPAVRVRVPSSLRTTPGGPNVTIPAAVSGTGVQRWHRNGVALLENAKFSGTTTSTLTVSNPVLADQGYYQLWVTDACGTVKSNLCYLRVVLCPSSPTITSEPVNATAALGTSVSFNVGATACVAPQFQWQFYTSTGWISIPGATSSTYTIASVNPSNAGNYRCRVFTTGSSSALSRVVTLNLTKPQILSTITRPVSCTTGLVTWTTNIPTYGLVLYGSSCGSLVNALSASDGLSTSHSVYLTLSGASSVQFKLIATDAIGQRTAGDCATAHFNDSPPNVEGFVNGSPNYADLFAANDGIPISVFVQNIGCTSTNGPVTILDLKINGLTPPRKADHSVDLPRTISATGLPSFTYANAYFVVSLSETGLASGSRAKVTGIAKYGEAPVQYINILGWISLP